MQSPPDDHPRAVYNHQVLDLFFRDPGEDRVRKAKLNILLTGDCQDLRIEWCTDGEGCDIQKWAEDFSTAIVP